MLMIVVMVMIVIMIIFVTHGLCQLFRGYRPLGWLGQFKDVVDHFLLVDRRPQFGDRARRLFEVVEDELFLTWKASCLLNDRAAQFFLANLDLGFVANFANHQAKAHSAFREFAELSARFIFGLALVFKGRA